MSEPIMIVEVGPRDGFQSLRDPIPTPDKLEIVRALHDAGVRRMEATAFVSRAAVPQMADAAEIVSETEMLADLDSQVLVPTARQAERALEAGARHLVFVLSVSPAHNQSNVRRSPEESAEEYAQMISALPAGVKVRLNVATAFDCPFNGRVPIEQTLALLDRLVPVTHDVEIGLCDTTGRADPAHVAALITECLARYPAEVRWAFHAHDTYGLGTANVLAAYNAGLRVFDASVAGLGGCPFAPGATGNVATEDLVWMFEQMGVPTGIDLTSLVAAARLVEAIPDAPLGGRVRNALGAAACARRVPA